MTGSIQTRTDWIDEEYSQTIPLPAGDDISMTIVPLISGMLNYCNLVLSLYSNFLALWSCLLLPVRKLASVNK
jgi:hypothetical protein